MVTVGGRAAVVLGALVSIESGLKRKKGTLLTRMGLAKHVEGVDVTVV